MHSLKSAPAAAARHLTPYRALGLAHVILPSNVLVGILAVTSCPCECPALNENYKNDSNVLLVEYGAIPKALPWEQGHDEDIAGVSSYWSRKRSERFTLAL